MHAGEVHEGLYPGEGTHTGAGEETEEEGVAEMKCYKLTQALLSCVAQEEREEEIEVGNEGVKFSLDTKGQWGRVF